MVVAANHISQGREALFDALYFDCVGDAVAQVLQFLVRGTGGYEQAFAVAGCEASDYPRAGDCAVADGDYVLQLGFEDAVEVLGGADGDEGVGVG